MKDDKQYSPEQIATAKELLLTMPTADALALLDVRPEEVNDKEGMPYSAAELFQKFTHWEHRHERNAILRISSEFEGLHGQVRQWLRSEGIEIDRLGQSRRDGAAACRQVTEALKHLLAARVRALRSVPEQLRGMAEAEERRQSGQLKMTAETLSGARSALKGDPDRLAAIRALRPKTPSSWKKEPWDKGLAHMFELVTTLSAKPGEPSAQARIRELCGTIPGGLQQVIVRGERLIISSASSLAEHQAALGALKGVLDWQFKFHVGNLQFDAAERILEIYKSRPEQVGAPQA